MTGEVQREEQGDVEGGERRWRGEAGKRRCGKPRPRFLDFPWGRGGSGVWRWSQVSEGGEPWVTPTSSPPPVLTWAPASG